MQPSPVVATTGLIQQLQLEQRYWQLRAEGLEMKAAIKKERVKRVQNIAKEHPSASTDRILDEVSEQVADALLLEADATLARANELGIRSRLKQMKMVTPFSHLPPSTRSIPNTPAVSFYSPPHVNVVSSFTGTSDSARMEKIDPKNSLQNLKREQEILKKKILHLERLLDQRDTSVVTRKAEDSSQEIPHGMRIKTMRIDARSKGAFVNSGDLVDVLVYQIRENKYPSIHSRVILRNIRVFAVGRAGEDGKSITVSLLLTPQQTNKVALAEKIGELEISPHPISTEGS